MQIEKIFLVVPKLIEQPTWGGDYILGLKKWSARKPFKGLKIGQSYELFSGTQLMADVHSSEDPDFTGELGYAADPRRFHFQGDKMRLIPLQSLIKNHPKELLGEIALKKTGKEVVLVKLTQAKGNSFQLHVKQKDESRKWKSKPESWYYLEPGLLTLGLKKNADINKYKNTCLEIENELKNLSSRIKAKKITYIKAKAEAKKIVEKYNPWKYVNSVKAKKGELIDLSPCGIHHSWEEDEKKYPLGNIVYELCADVMDPVSSIRSFDKGKIKQDGSLRKVQIEDYFKYIDKSPKANDPKAHIMKPKVLYQDENIKIASLLRAKFYCMDEITINENSEHRFSTGGSYNHIYIRSGRAVIKSSARAVILTAGHSCLIPACLKNYEILPVKGKCEILKTFIR